MQFYNIVSMLALAIAANAAAIATRMENTVDVSAPASIFKRGTSILVTGSGGARFTENDSNSATASVSCGTITVSNFDGHAGLCSAVLAGGFSGCDGCEWNGSFDRFALKVSTKCGNAHIQIGVDTASGDDEGAGDIGENLNVKDCDGKSGGNVKKMNICAGNDWTLFRC